MAVKLSIGANSPDTAAKAEARRAWIDAQRIEEGCRLLGHVTKDAVRVWDIEADMLSWTDAASTPFGYASAQAGRSSWWWEEKIHPNDKDHVVESLHSVIAGIEQHWSSEYRFRRADGSWADVFDRGCVMRDADGAPLKVIGVMQDITGRKQSERFQTLLAAETNHRARNMLAIVQAILRQTRAANVEDYAEAAGAHRRARANLCPLVREPVRLRRPAPARGRGAGPVSDRRMLARAP